MPTEPEQFFPVVVKPEDNELRTHLYEILAMPPPHQMPAFTKLLGVTQVCFRLKSS